MNVPIDVCDNKGREKEGAKQVLQSCAFFVSLLGTTRIMDSFWGKNESNDSLEAMATDHTRLEVCY